MKLSIINPGLLATVQDLGRKGFMAEGLPVSGCMDTLSARIANLVLGNDENAAVIEFTFGGARLRAESDLLISYSGEGAILMAEDEVLPSDRPLFIPSGVGLSFINEPDGCRTYLAVAGGWDVPLVLGSRSTYLVSAIGGLEGRALQKGDSLSNNAEMGETTEKILNGLKGGGIRFPGWSVARRLLLEGDRNRLRVVPGPEFPWFEGGALVDFLTVPFKLSTQSNRMGYRLEGPAMKRQVKGELLSTAVSPGTIQVTGDGAMVLLMADCQTTGGYPRIAQLAAVDLPLCAQLKPGDLIGFEEISRREAENLYIEQEEQLLKLKASLSFVFDRKL